MYGAVRCGDGFSLFRDCLLYTSVADTLLYFTKKYLFLRTIGKSVCSLLVRLRLMPVSYTHLDVYKRQTWRRTAGCTGTIR